MTIQKLMPNTAIAMPLEIELTKSAGPPTKKNVGVNTTPIGAVHKVAYMALFALFLAQLVAILYNHSHLGGLSMFDTVMLLIIKADTVGAHKWLFNENNVAKCETTPFLLIVACTVFEALIFVNFTHAVEAITCANSSSHFSVPFLATVGLNLIVKSPLFFASHKMAVPDISTSRRYFLHFGAPLATILLVVTNHYFSPGTDELISTLDRYLGAGMCVLLSIVVLPLFKQNVPYLLCDVPKGVREDQLKAEIEHKFPNISCTHLHIYSKWPGHKFDVFLHVSIDNNSMPSHGRASPSLEAALQRLIHALQLLLRTKGARCVTIQPLLAVHGEQPKQNKHEQKDSSSSSVKEFSMCISERCLRENKSCCRREEEEKGDGLCGAGA